MDTPPLGAAAKDFLGDRSHTMAKSPMISRDKSDMTKSISCMCNISLELVKSGLGRKNLFL